MNDIPRAQSAAQIPPASIPAAAHGSRTTALAGGIVTRITVAAGAVPGGRRQAAALCCARAAQTALEDPRRPPT